METMAGCECRDKILIKFCSDCFAHTHTNSEISCVCCAQLCCHLWCSICPLKLRQANEGAPRVSLATLSSSSFISNFEARMGHNFAFLFAFTGARTHSFANWTVNDTHQRREISARSVYVDLWWDFWLSLTSFNCCATTRRKRIFGRDVNDEFSLRRATCVLSAHC